MRVDRGGGPVGGGKGEVERFGECFLLLPPGRIAKVAALRCFEMVAAWGC